MPAIEADVETETEAKARQPARRVVEIDVVLAERLKDIEASIAYGLKGVNDQLAKLNGTVAEHQREIGLTHDWQNRHDNVHQHDAGLNEGRREVIATITSRDRWLIGALIPVTAIVVSVAVKLIGG